MRGNFQITSIQRKAVEKLSRDGSQSNREKFDKRCFKNLNAQSDTLVSVARSQKKIKQEKVGLQASAVSGSTKSRQSTNKQFKHLLHHQNSQVTDQHQLEIEAKMAARAMQEQAACHASNFPYQSPSNLSMNNTVTVNACDNALPSQQSTKSRNNNYTMHLNKSESNFADDCCFGNLNDQIKKNNSKGRNNNQAQTRSSTTLKMAAQMQNSLNGRNSSSALLPYSAGKVAVDAHLTTGCLQQHQNLNSTKDPHRTMLEHQHSAGSYYQDRQKAQTISSQADFTGLETMQSQALTMDHHHMLQRQDSSEAMNTLGNQPDFHIDRTLVKYNNHSQGNIGEASSNSHPEKIRVNKLMSYHGQESNQNLTTAFAKRVIMTEQKYKAHFSTSQKKHVPQPCHAAYDQGASSMNDQNNITDQRFDEAIYHRAHDNLAHKQQMSSAKHPHKVGKRISSQQSEKAEHTRRVEGLPSHNSNYTMKMNQNFIGTASYEKLETDSACDLDQQNSYARLSAELRAAQFENYVNQSTQKQLQTQPRHMQDERFLLESQSSQEILNPYQQFYQLKCANEQSYAQGMKNIDSVDLRPEPEREHLKVALGQKNQQLLRPAISTSYLETAKQQLRLQQLSIKDNLQEHQKSMKIMQHPMQQLFRQQSSPEIVQTKAMLGHSMTETPNEKLNIQFQGQNLRPETSLTYHYSQEALQQQKNNLISLNKASLTSNGSLKELAFVSNQNADQPAPFITRHPSSRHGSAQPSSIKASAQNSTTILPNFQTNDELVLSGVNSVGYNPLQHVEQHQLSDHANQAYYKGYVPDQQHETGPNQNFSQRNVLQSHKFGGKKRNQERNCPLNQRNMQDMINQATHSRRPSFETSQSNYRPTNKGQSHINPYFTANPMPSNYNDQSTAPSANYDDPMTMSQVYSCSKFLNGPAPSVSGGTSTAMSDQNYLTAGICTQTLPARACSVAEIQPIDNIKYHSSNLSYTGYQQKKQQLGNGSLMHMSHTSALDDRLGTANHLKTTPSTELLRTAPFASSREEYSKLMAKQLLTQVKPGILKLIQSKVDQMVNELCDEPGLADQQDTSHILEERSDKQIPPKFDPGNLTSILEANLDRANTQSQQFLHSSQPRGQEILAVGDGERRGSELRTQLHANNHSSQQDLALDRSIYSDTMITQNPSRQLNEHQQLQQQRRTQSPALRCNRDQLSLDGTVDSGVSSQQKLMCTGSNSRLYQPVAPRPSSIEGEAVIAGLNSAGEIMQECQARITANQMREGFHKEDEGTWSELCLGRLAREDKGRQPSQEEDIESQHLTLESSVQRGVATDIVDFQYQQQLYPDVGGQTNHMAEAHELQTDRLMRKMQADHEDQIANARVVNFQSRPQQQNDEFKVTFAGSTGQKGSFDMAADKPSCYPQPVTNDARAYGKMPVEIKQANINHDNLVSFDPNKFQTQQPGDQILTLVGNLPQQNHQARQVISRDTELSSPTSSIALENSYQMSSNNIAQSQHQQEAYDHSEEDHANNHNIEVYDQDGVQLSMSEPSSDHAIRQMELQRQATLFHLQNALGHAEGKDVLSNQQRQMLQAGLVSQVCQQRMNTFSTSELDPQRSSIPSTHNYDLIDQFGTQDLAPDTNCTFFRQQATGTQANPSNIYYTAQNGQNFQVQYGSNQVTFEQPDLISGVNQNSQQWPPQNEDALISVQEQMEIQNKASTSNFASSQGNPSYMVAYEAAGGRINAISNMHSQQSQLASHRNPKVIEGRGSSIPQSTIMYCDQASITTRSQQLGNSNYDVRAEGSIINIKQRTAATNLDSKMLPPNPSKRDKSQQSAGASKRKQSKDSKRSKGKRNLAQRTQQLQMRDHSSKKLISAAPKKNLMKTQRRPQEITRSLSNQRCGSNYSTERVLSRQKNFRSHLQLPSALSFQMRKLQPARLTQQSRVNRKDKYESVHSSKSPISRQSTLMKQRGSATDIHNSKRLFVSSKKQPFANRHNTKCLTARTTPMKPRKQNLHGTIENEVLKSLKQLRRNNFDAKCDLKAIYDHKVNIMKQELKELGRQNVDEYKKQLQFQQHNTQLHKRRAQQYKEMANEMAGFAEEQKLRHEKLLRYMSAQPAYRRDRKHSRKRSSSVQLVNKSVQHSRITSSKHTQLLESQKQNTKESQRTLHKNSSINLSRDLQTNIHHLKVNQSQGIAAESHLADNNTKQTCEALTAKGQHYGSSQRVAMSLFDSAIIRSAENSNSPQNTTAQLRQKLGNLNLSEVCTKSIDVKRDQKLNSKDNIKVPKNLETTISLEPTQRDQKMLLNEIAHVSNGTNQTVPQNDSRQTFGEVNRQDLLRSFGSTQDYEALHLGQKSLFDSGEREILISPQMQLQIAERPKQKESAKISTNMCSNCKAVRVEMELPCPRCEILNCKTDEKKKRSRDKQYHRRNSDTSWDSSDLNSEYQQSSRQKDPYKRKKSNKLMVCSSELIANQARLDQIQKILYRPRQPRQGSTHSRYKNVVQDAYGDTHDTEAPWLSRERSSHSAGLAVRDYQEESNKVTLPQMIEELRQCRQNLKY